MSHARFAPVAPVRLVQIAIAVVAAIAVMAVMSAPSQAAPPQKKTSWTWNIGNVEIGDIEVTAEDVITVGDITLIEIELNKNCITVGVVNVLNCSDTEVELEVTTIIEDVLNIDVTHVEFKRH